MTSPSSPSEILKNPEKVEIAPQGRTVEKIDQRVYFVPAASKRALLSHLLNDETLERVIVFTRTKRGANRVAEALEDRGVRSEAIHGNKSQNARQKALDNFSRGRARVLVATDLASRGIDVTGVTHVINYELPADAESYVHRIGRTARAGASGIALSFCDGSERGQLKSIERLTNQRIAVVQTPANEDMPAAPPLRPKAERDARDEGERREHRGNGHGPKHANGNGGGNGRGGRGGHRPFGERSRGDRPSRRPRPSISGRAATIAKPRRASAPTTIARAPARRRANAPTAPARTPTGPIRRARKATARSAARRAAAVASAAVGRWWWPRRSRPRCLKNPFLAEDFQTLAKSVLVPGALFCDRLVVPFEEAALGLEADAALVDVASAGPAAGRRRW